MNRQPHATKSGPGRYHAQGTKRSPATNRRRGGAGAGFAQHTATAAKKLRRANVQTLGRRQAIKAEKRERRESLPESLCS